MRRFFLVLGLAIILLAGCGGWTAGGGPQTVERTPSSTVNSPSSTGYDPSSTLHGPPSVVYGQSPTETPTPTPKVPVPAAVPPCNPLTESCFSDGHFLLDRPIALPGSITIDPAYPYGSTGGGQREPHHGVEFYNASGTPVLAAAEGIVVAAGTDETTAYGPQTNFYGNLIVLEHHFPGVNQTVFTLYGHLSKIDVQIDQEVQRGEKIGEVGATGLAIGSHLHFEVRLGENNYGATHNPILWLKPLADEQGTPHGVIAGRLIDGQSTLLQTPEINFQYFPDPNGAQVAVYQIGTYAADSSLPQAPVPSAINSDDEWQENFALGDLPAGSYRLSLMWGGRLYDRWIEVQPGKVTLVLFQIDR